MHACTPATQLLLQSDIQESFVCLGPRGCLLLRAVAADVALLLAVVALGVAGGLRALGREVALLAAVEATARAVAVAAAAAAALVGAFHLFVRAVARDVAHLAAVVARLVGVDVAAVVVVAVAGRAVARHWGKKGGRGRGRKGVLCSIFVYGVLN